MTLSPVRLEAAQGWYGSLLLIPVLSPQHAASISWPYMAALAPAIMLTLKPAEKGGGRKTLIPFQIVTQNVSTSLPSMS